MDMTENIQWVIETVGKLGPMSVAAAVFLANQRQNRWAASAVVRSANLEDQKMRLALVDKRLAVIEHFRSARDNLLKGTGGPEAFNDIMSALRQAELIFEDDEHKAITGCLVLVVSFQNKYGGRLYDQSADDRDGAIQAYQAIVNHINVVMKQLREASRVSVLPPLTAPK